MALFNVNRLAYTQPANRTKLQRRSIPAVSEKNCRFYLCRAPEITPRSAAPLPPPILQAPSPPFRSCFRPTVLNTGAMHVSLGWIGIRRLAPDCNTPHWETRLPTGLQNDTKGSKGCISSEMVAVGEGCSKIECSLLTMRSVSRDVSPCAKAGSRPQESASKSDADAKQRVNKIPARARSPSQRRSRHCCLD